MTSVLLFTLGVARFREEEVSSSALHSLDLPGFGLHQKALVQGYAVAISHEVGNWGGIRDNVLTFLHSGEPEVEALLEGLEAFRLVA